MCLISATYVITFVTPVTYVITFVTGVTNVIRYESGPTCHELVIKIQLIYNNYDR